MFTKPSVIHRIFAQLFTALAALAVIPLHAATTLTIDAPGCSSGGAMSWNAATKTVYCLGATATPSSTLTIAGKDCLAGTAIGWNATTFSLSCVASTGATPAANLVIAVSLPDCVNGSVGWNAATKTLTCRLVASVPAAGVLNIDQSTASSYDPLTDGLLLMRYLFGVRGDALTASALGTSAARRDPVAIAAYLDGVHGALDVDNNGVVDALTDGTLIMRYLFGLRGQVLINGAVGSGAIPGTATAIEARIQALMP